MKRITPIIQYINDNINKHNDEFICQCLQEYLSTSYSRYINDKLIQPGFNKDIRVIYYQTYPNETRAMNHKTNRLWVIFDNNNTAEISLYKFKRYLRHNFVNLDRYYTGKYMDKLNI